MFALPLALSPVSSASSASPVSCARPSRAAAFAAFLTTLVTAAALLATPTPSLAQGAAATAPRGVDLQALRRNLSQQMPNLPPIDEVRATPIAGLYEVRLGAEILYSNADGNYLVAGELYDTRTHVNLTQARVDDLTRFDFDKLPFKDAIAIKQGSGARKIAVFVDPNCGYCKRFEADVAALKDVTVYAFLYPILGEDSQAKSRNIWCAADPGKAWREWMLQGKAAPAAKDGCDAAALQRNVALGQKHRVQGTPATVLPNGKRLPGAVPRAELVRAIDEAVKG